MPPTSGYITAAERKLIKPVPPRAPPDLNTYYRTTLLNRGADPLITDDISRNADVSRAMVLNLRYNGHTGSADPFLNEVTLHDTTPDPRGVYNEPPMQQLRELNQNIATRAKVAFVPDATHVQPITDYLSQYQEVQRATAAREMTKNMTLVFKRERQNAAYNPNRRGHATTDPRRPEP